MSVQGPTEAWQSLQPSPPPPEPENGSTGLPGAGMAQSEALPVALVTWRDAWSDHGESQPKDWADEWLVQTVGFVVRNDAVVSVAQEATPDGFRCVTHIPAALVVSVLFAGPFSPSLI